MCQMAEWSGREMKETTGHRAQSPEYEAFREVTKSGRAGSNWYVSLLGLHPQDPIKIFKRVEKGLAFQALERFQKNTGLSTRDLADAIIIKMRTLNRRKEQGRLEPEESDRLMRVSRIFGKALELFEGNTDAARQWLFTGQRALAGERPMVLAKTDLGAREVEALIDRLEHGVLT
jgi:putative toxin-antitoxin system antitoxin component (TIGR02293 family)